MELTTDTESLWSTAPPSFLAPAFRCSFATSTPSAANIREVKYKKHDRRDAYALRQSEMRKQANLSRRAVLNEEKAKSLGDPIRGITTPFVQSFDNYVPQDVASDADESTVSLLPVEEGSSEPSPSPAHASKESALDHGISHEELDKALRFSRMLTEPLPPSQKATADREKEAAERQRWEARNKSATEAVQRIVSLANASSMHRTKKNVERIVQTFGRHNTDETLKPKAPAKVTSSNAPAATPRAGPDTGSSEVQIGILTAKIRVLADRYEGEARQDKINKRNLRLLLHRRQKLLKYMEKKERGSERWFHMINTLGLSPATWKGEIAVQ